MKVTQEFDGPVTHVAGRDIRIRNFVVVPPVQEAITEAEEQRRFFENTGISCCRDAREFYLTVLNDGRFSVDELRHAIRQGSIRWEFGATQPTIVMPWTEPVFAWMLFSFMGLYALVMVLAIFIRWDDVANWAMLHAFLFAVFCTAIMVLAQKYILEPRRIAIRVQDWMAGRGVR